MNKRYYIALGAVLAAILCTGIAVLTLSSRVREQGAAESVPVMAEAAVTAAPESAPPVTAEPEPIMPEAAVSTAEPGPEPEPVNYTGLIPHIFFHSLIVYPEMIYTDMETPRIENNQEFCLLSELEKLLPQLYERGYVLYDLNDCFRMADGKMQRQEILLPPGKKPLILSVDDVAYAYGDGYAQALRVEDGELIWYVKNPQGEIEKRRDGDVMGVVDAFVAEHPDFSHNGHKGTIALTGFQGAFGYPDYESAENIEGIRTVAEALKADGWNFASHSYTHNGGEYGYWGEGLQPEKIRYDINKWVERCTPALGETRLFIAPFGCRVTDETALRSILDAGFDVYCTVDDEVINELYDDYALTSRVEICGYSFTYFQDTLNEWFCSVDEVFDPSARPPVPK